MRNSARPPEAGKPWSPLAPPEAGKPWSPLAPPEAGKPLAGWILDAGYWKLDSGYWMLMDPRYKMQGSWRNGVVAYRNAILRISSTPSLHHSCL